MDELKRQLETEDLERYAEIIEEDYVVDYVRMLNQEYENKTNKIPRS